MSLAHIQYSDFRHSAYQTGLQDLIPALHQLNFSIPEHFIYKSFYTKVEAGSPKPKIGRCYGSVSGSGTAFSIFSKPRPGGFMEIKFGDVFRLLQNCDSADTLFIRPSRFKTAAHLLDAIYVDYFAGKYSPFSYGSEWHLRRGSFASQLAIDWKLLDTNFMQDSSPINFMQESPEYYWFVPESQWEVSDDATDGAIALGAYDKWLIETILDQPKAAGFLISKLMRPIDAAGFGEIKLGSIAVAKNFLFFPTRSLPTQFFVQTKDCSPELKARWDY